MEYIFTNLPQYIRITPQSAFSSSIVEPGHALLFMPTSSSVMAKLPDGSFITVGGSGGTDVSSTTAQAGDVLSGKVFYNSGGDKTSGTIPTVSAAVVSGAVVVPSGYIANSQSFPVSSGGGETDFYKCAATVTSGGTAWSGYLAVLSGGSYTYVSSATPGLSCGGGFTPEVGKVYTDGALVRAELYTGIPQDGLVLFISGDSLTTAETGQTLTTSTPGITLYNDSELGSCLNFFRPSEYDDGGKMTCSSGISSSSSPWTLSVWIKRNGDYDPENDWYASGVIFCYSASCSFFSNNSGLGLYNNADILQTSYTTTIWNHLCLIWANDTFNLYINGVLANSASGSNNTNKETAIFGRHESVSGAYGLRAYLKNIRLYDRALSTAEVAALAAEFTPTA